MEEKIQNEKCVICLNDKMELRQMEGMEGKICLQCFLEIIYIRERRNRNIGDEIKKTKYYKKLQKQNVEV